MSVTFLSRSDWGANAAHRRRGHVVPDSQFVGFVAHHTVTTVNIDFRNDHATNLVEVRRHMRYLQTIRPDLGMDVPYSFVFFWLGDGDWAVCEGRGWGRTGAHTSGYNSTRLAVAFAGNAQIVDLPNPRAVFEYLASSPHAPAVYQPIFSHDKVYATACCGTNYRRWLPELQAPYTGESMTSPKGHVDLYAETDDGKPSQYVEGWAYEPGFDGYNEIHIWEFSDKGEALRVIGTGTADQSRPSVAAVFPDAPVKCGFKVKLTQTGNRNIVVFAIDAPGTLGSNTNLTGSPRAVTVPSAPAPAPTPTPTPTRRAPEPVAAPDATPAVKAWSRIISLANQISDIGEDNV